jgi:hypothetical protein
MGGWVVRAGYSVVDEESKSEYSVVDEGLGGRGERRVGGGDKSNKDKFGQSDTPDNGDRNVRKADPFKPNKDGSQIPTLQNPSDAKKQPKIIRETEQKKSTGDALDQHPLPHSKKSEQEKPKQQTTTVNPIDNDAKDKKPKQEKPKTNKLAPGESEIVTKTPQVQDKAKAKEKPPTDWQEGSGSDGGIGDSPNKNPKKPKKST